jgi:predicted lactoylglutathione lyase
VTNLGKSIAFYEAIGATADPHFRDESCQMMRFSEEICVMIMTLERFSSFTPRGIPNAHETAQVLLALSAESRDEVDATVTQAATTGGEADPNPQQEHGFMYGRSFADPDGHIWEVCWMDMAAAMGANAETAS